jgi:glycerophosphoryl diester phosphodiesterase
MAPENTLASLAAAVDHGASSVELDVMTAACGTPVLFHDTMLGRTTNGVGPLKRRPLSQLKALDAGSWFDPRFAGERIPTLEEGLSQLSGRVDRVYQDIKGYREMEDLDRMATITREAGMADSSVFVASEETILNRLRQTAPGVRRAYLVGTAEDLQRGVDWAGPEEDTMLSVEIGLALSHPDIVQQAMDAGTEVVTWTVNDRAQATAAWEIGISRITTDDVEGLLAWSRALP